MTRFALLFTAILAVAIFVAPVLSEAVTLIEQAQQAVANVNQLGR